MSDEENQSFVTGPIDVAEEASKPKAKRVTTRKKKEPGEEKKPVTRRRKKTDEVIGETTNDAQSVASEASVNVKSEKPESVKTERVDKPVADSKPQSQQKELLFSSDSEDDSNNRSSERENDRENDSSENEQSSAEDGSDGDSQKNEERNRGDQRFGRGGNFKNNFKNKQNKKFPQQNPHNNPHNNQHQQPFQQQQLSNRKKKQQQWKEKQKQKKQKKDRFKVDGLSSEFDNSLELGQLSEWDKLQNEESLTQFLAELPELKPDSFFNFNEIYILPLDQLREACHATHEAIPSAPNRKQLIEHLLSHAHKEQKRIEVSGVLEILDDGNGMLTFASDSYRLLALSTFVPAFFIKKFGLLRGHHISGRMIPAIEDASCPILVEITEVQGLAPEKANEIVPFTEQIPYYPTKRIFLESDKQEDANKVSMRVVDLISPIGFGQRGLIVAPPRTGKTILLQGMANAIQQNYPNAQLIILLIDERPEEVTDFRRRVKGGEVISSTFDENAESHVHAAEMVIEKSRRMVEAGKDVVILLDSITRLARAYNTVMPNSGKILSGGVEANALQKPKRFFGSARNIEGGGSLTIIATALVETGSKMDEVIFEEFKGTGNMELHLDRALVDKRVFPALSMEKSGTRKEELLYHPDELLKIYGLRRAMKGVPSTDAMEMLITKVKKTGSNAEFLMTAAR